VLLLHLPLAGDGCRHVRLPLQWVLCTGWLVWGCSVGCSGAATPGAQRYARKSKRCDEDSARRT
jgi:hypothetical protein